jgi:hypothetical protein
MAMRRFTHFGLGVVLAGAGFLLAATVTPLWTYAQSVVAGAGVATPLATTNRSVTITLGSTFQTILTGGSQRRSVTIENNNTNTDNCWLFVGSASATTGTGILLLPGGSYSRYWPYVPSDVIQGTCASTNDTLYVDTQ